MAGICAVVSAVSAPLPSGIAALAVGPAAHVHAAAPEAMLLEIQAQPSRQPVINVGKVILAEPASETALPIQVGPLEAIPRNSFVRIRGLPHQASLSEGHSISPGAWAIPLAGLPTLKISLPVGLSGKSSVTISLVQIDGAVLSEVSTSLVVAAASLIAPPNSAPQQKSVASLGRTAPALEAPAAPRSPAMAPPARSFAPAPSAAATEALRRAAAFVERGRRQFDQGNVSAARLFFQRAAEAGSAEGALAMAATFDPLELGRLRAAGVQPDVAAAREWYLKARNLGSVEADGRLQRLGAR